MEQEGQTYSFTNEEKRLLAKLHDAWTRFEYVDNQGIEPELTKHRGSKADGKGAPRSFDDSLLIRDAEYLTPPRRSHQPARTGRVAPESRRSTSFGCWVQDGSGHFNIDVEEKKVPDGSKENSEASLDFPHFLSQMEKAKYRLHENCKSCVDVRRLPFTAWQTLGICILDGWTPKDSCSAVLQAWTLGDGLVCFDEWSWHAMLCSMDDLCALLLPELSLHLYRHLSSPSELFTNNFDAFLVDIFGPFIVRHIVGRALCNQSILALLWNWVGILSWKQHELLNASTDSGFNVVLKLGKEHTAGYSTRFLLGSSKSAGTIVPSKNLKVSPQQVVDRYMGDSVTEEHFMNVFLTLPKVFLPVRKSKWITDKKRFLYSINDINRSRIRKRLNKMDKRDGTAYATKHNDTAAYFETMLRMHYFLRRCSGRRKPDSRCLLQFEQYDWIGFDMDHTLIDYKTDATTALIWEASLTHLIQTSRKERKHGEDTHVSPGNVVNYLVQEYPGLERVVSPGQSDSAVCSGPELHATIFEFSGKEYPPCWLELAKPGYIVDTMEGNIIVVDATYCVRHVYHGGRSVLGEEAPAKYIHHTHDSSTVGECLLCYLDSLKQREDRDRSAADGSSARYAVILSYFDAPVLPLYALLVSACDDLIRFHCGVFQEGIYNQLWAAAQKSTRFSYSRFSLNGWSTVLENPTKFVRLEKCKHIKRWIRGLRYGGSGLKVMRCFLLTNSDWKQTNTLMSTAFGSDWLSLFDMVIVNAKKSKFRQGLASTVVESCQESTHNEASSKQYNRGANDKPKYFAQLNPDSGKVQRLDDAFLRHEEKQQPLAEELSARWGVPPVNVQALRASGNPTFETAAVLSGGGICQFLATMEHATRSERPSSEKTSTRFSVLYIGDHVYNDIVAPTVDDVIWHTIAISPEMTPSTLPCKALERIESSEEFSHQFIPVKDAFPEIKEEHQNNTGPVSINGAFTASNWESKPTTSVVPSNEFWIDRLSLESSVLRVPSVCWLMEILRTRKRYSSIPLIVGSSLLLANTYNSNRGDFRSSIDEGDLVATVTRLQDLGETASARGDNVFSRLLEFFSSPSSKKLLNAFFTLNRENEGTSKTPRTKHSLALVPGRSTCVCYNGIATLKTITQSEAKKREFSNEIAHSGPIRQSKREVSKVI